MGYSTPYLTFSFLVFHFTVYLSRVGVGFTVDFSSLDFGVRYLGYSVDYGCFFTVGKTGGDTSLIVFDRAFWLRDEEPAVVPSMWDTSPRQRSLCGRCGTTYLVGDRHACSPMEPRYEVVVGVGQPSDTDVLYLRSVGGDVDRGGHLVGDLTARMKAAFPGPHDTYKISLVQSFINQCLRTMIYDRVLFYDEGDLVWRYEPKKPESVEEHS